MARIEPLGAGDLRPPDLSPFSTGNCGIPFVYRFTADAPGPDVVINALMHGNEYSGAIAAVRLLSANIQPVRGSLTICFANVAAFGQFDAQFPIMSRYLDEDMNRIWSPTSLALGHDSREMLRARALWPLFAHADMVLDLHSMQHDRIPLMLCGSSARGRAFARAMAFPGTIVADQGHIGGSRLIDHPRFVNGHVGPVALLAECGQHWDQESAEVATVVAARFLLIAGIADPVSLRPWLPSSPLPPPRFVQVTDTVTAKTGRFRFTAAYKGMDIIPLAGSLYAMDGEEALRTPYDDCVLIMPSLHCDCGQTAVRLGRFIA